MDASRRLAILAQFDPDGGLPTHVRIHLEHLRPLVERLVLISNSPLKDAARARAGAICDRVVLRDNIGWDFAAWRDALAGESPDEWDWTILTNSSVIGPLFPLAPIFDRMEASGVDFWGMTRSREIRPHLQSWFLAFSGSATASDAWHAFWAGVRDFLEKRRVIRDYELGLTATLEAAGLRSQQVVTFAKWRLQPTLRPPFVFRPNNATIHAPVQLIANGVPYLKASLVWGPQRFRKTQLDWIKQAAPHYPWGQLNQCGILDYSSEHEGKHWVDE